MSDKLYREAKSATAVSFRTYLTDDQLKEVCANHDAMIRVMVTAYHDKDTKLNGEPKEPHTHGYILLDRTREVKNVKSWFVATDESGRDVQTHIEAVLDTVGCDDYLTHNTVDAKSELKYQYEENIIKVLKGERDAFRAFRTNWMKSVDARVKKEEKADEVEQLLQDVIDGVDARKMARRYGRDYVKNVKAYRSYASMMVMEEEGDLSKAIEVEGRWTHDALDRERNIGAKEGMLTALKVVRNSTQAKVKAGETSLKGVVAELEHIIKTMEG